MFQECHALSRTVSALSVSFPGILPLEHDHCKCRRALPSAFPESASVCKHAGAVGSTAPSLFCSLWRPMRTCCPQSPKSHREESVVLDGAEDLRASSCQKSPRFSLYSIVMGFFATGPLCHLLWFYTDHQWSFVILWAPPPNKYLKPLFWYPVSNNIHVCRRQHMSLKTILWLRPVCVTLCPGRGYHGPCQTRGMAALQVLLLIVRGEQLPLVPH